MHNMFEKTSKTAGIDESTIKTSEINKANKSYPGFSFSMIYYGSLHRVILLAKLANYGVDGQH